MTAPTFNERTWLSWLVKARIIIITFLLGIELALEAFTAAAVCGACSSAPLWSGTPSPFFTWCCCICGVKTQRLQARLQILSDLAFATVIVYATGGIDTSFNFLYPLVILIAAYDAAALSGLPGRRRSRSSCSAGCWSWLPRPDSVLLPHPLRSENACRQRSSSTSLPTSPLPACELIGCQAAHGPRGIRGKERRVGALAGPARERCESISGGVITTDLEGQIRLVNPAGARLLGRAPEEMIGQPIAALFSEKLPQLGAARDEFELFSPGRGGKSSWHDGVRAGGPGYRRCRLCIPLPT